MNDKKKIIKIILFTIWMSVLVSLIIYFIRMGIPLSEYLAQIKTFIEKFGIIAPLVYILVYTIRPLVFFPATLLTTLSGALFGPVYGIMYTIIGENFSANIGFIAGKYFGKNLMEQMTSKNRIMSEMDCKFRDNGFISVLIMRLIYMPFDIVGYMSGMCNLKQKDFALATFIGILPGIITFVLLGSSFTDIRNIIVSIIFLILGIVISKYLKKKKSAQKIL